MAIKTLFTAHAHAEGGRNGHTKADDDLVSVDLSVPKAMGGPGKPATTTPEHLFAAGYAACLGGAIDFQAKQLKVPVTNLTVNSSVSIGQSEDGGFGLAVTMDVEVAGVTQEEAEKVVEAGHAFCPYSKAIKGNVDVTVNAKAV